MDSLVIVVYGLIVLVGIIDFVFFLFFLFAASWAGWEYWIRKRNGFTHRIFHVSAASAGKFFAASIRNFTLLLFWQLTNPVGVLIPLVITIIIQVWLGVSYIGIAKELLFVIEEPDELSNQPYHSSSKPEVKKHL